LDPKLTAISFVEVNLFIICGSMPTFRKFLKRFAPKFLGTWGSNPSKSYAYDMSASKLHHRQQRTGYAQFDDHEMDRMSDKAGKGPRVLSKPTAAPGVDEPAASAGCKAQSHARDDTSEEAILDDKGITYTRTFHVEYSK
jgi:hypothetical protein